MSDEAQILNEMRRYYEKICQDLSDHPLMERTIVAGFLHVLGIEYKNCEIQKKESNDSIDVCFRGVHFQVTESLDKGRLRDKELCERKENLKRALATKDFEYFRKAVEGSGPFSPPTNYTPEDYFQRIFCCSERKVKKYRRVDGDIDLLVYINLRDISLGDTKSWPDLTPLKNHGWRSVSFVDGVYARVLYAKKNSPAFLQEAMGKTHGDPKNDRIFPQELGPEEKCEAKTA